MPVEMCGRCREAKDPDRVYRLSFGEHGIYGSGPFHKTRIIREVKKKPTLWDWTVEAACGKTFTFEVDSSD